MTLYILKRKYAQTESHLLKPSLSILIIHKYSIMKCQN